MQDIFDEFPGKWAIISTSAGKLIGRIIKETENFQEVILQPVFDYMPQLIRQNNGGIGKDVLVLPFDICTSLNTCLHVYNLSSILLFDELNPDDKSQYEKTVRKGAEIARQARAIKSNLIFTNHMPGQPPNKF